MTVEHVLSPEARARICASVKATLIVCSGIAALGVVVGLGVLLLIGGSSLVDYFNVGAEVGLAMRWSGCAAILVLVGALLVGILGTAYNEVESSCLRAVHAGLPWYYWLPWIGTPLPPLPPEPEYDAVATYADELLARGEPLGEVKIAVIRRFEAWTQSEGEFATSTQETR